jgi:hypothetical protein
MKVTQSLLVVMIAACMAAAQSAPSSTSTAAKTAAAKAVPTTPAAGVPGQKPAVAPPSTAAKPPAPTKPTAKPAASATVAGHQPKAEKANAKKTAAAPGKDDKGNKDNVSIRNKRDPFVSVIQARNSIIPSCAAGKKCLIVDQLVLKGVVKSQNGMLAVVENSQRKAYFLRENDPVFNGQVYKITGDSIIFKEKVLDKLGKESVREVVKRVNKPA